MSMPAASLIIEIMSLYSASVNPMVVSASMSPSTVARIPYPRMRMAKERLGFATALVYDGTAAAADGSVVAPHSGQNAAPSGSSAPHLVQNLFPSMRGGRALT